MAGVLRSITLSRGRFLIEIHTLSVPRGPALYEIFGLDSLVGPVVGIDALPVFESPFFRIKAPVLVEEGAHFSLMDVTVFACIPLPNGGGLLEFGVLVGFVIFKAIKVVDVAPLLVWLLFLPVRADIFHNVSLELAVGISLTSGAFRVKSVDWEALHGLKQLGNALSVKLDPALEIILYFEALVARVVGVNGTPVLLAPFLAGVEMPLGLKELAKSTALLHDVVLRGRLNPVHVGSIVKFLLIVSILTEFYGVREVAFLFFDALFYPKLATVSDQTFHQSREMLSMGSLFVWVEGVVRDLVCVGHLAPQDALFIVPVV